MVCDEAKDLPPELHIPRFQVAGHRFGEVRIKQGKKLRFAGVLSHVDGYILKGKQSDSRGKCEHDFFQKVWFSSSSEFTSLRRHVPRFFGIYTHPALPQDTFLKLEDFTHGCCAPCIADLKCGAFSNCPDCTDEEVLNRRMLNTSNLSSVGVYICGMSIYDSDLGALRSVALGKNVTKPELLTSLSNYLEPLPSNMARIFVIDEFLKKLQEIINDVLLISPIAIFGSSVLIIYDLGRSAASQSTSCDLVSPLILDSDKNQTSIIHVPDTKMLPVFTNDLEKQSDFNFYIQLKLIDFAHTCTHPSGSSSLLFGLNSLINYLKEIKQMCFSQLILN